MEKALTRFAQHEQAAEAALAENARQAAIEAKLTSPGVALLNDQAELEIWGSRDRTYTHPETGDIIASPDKPMVGLLEGFAKTRPGPEAKVMAEKYEAGLTDLLDEGFELCQAKLVMDMRMSDEQEGIPGFTTQLMKHNGLSAEEAEKKAQHTYKKKDEKRVTLIKENGIVTAGEYERVRNGDSAGNDKNQKPDVKDDPPKKTPEEDPEDERDPEAEKLQKKIENARDEYARLLAQNSVTLRGAKSGTRSEAIEAAKADWIAAAKEIADYGQASILEKFKHLSDDDKKEMKKVQISKALIQEQYLLEERKYKHAEEVSERGPKSFLKLWRSKSGEGKIARGSKTVAKLGITAGLIAAAGVAAPVAGAVAFGARSHGKRFDKLAEKAGLDADQAYRKTEALKKNNSGFSFEDIADVSQEMTDERVNDNRLRFAGSLAAGAALGYGAAQLVEFATGGADAAGGEAPGQALTDNSESLVDGEVPNQTITETDSTAATGEGVDNTAGVEDQGDGSSNGEGADSVEFEAAELQVGIENGDGFTNLLHREFGLDGNQSWQLYQDLVEQVGGENIIDGIGTYMENGEYRISSPGDAEWTPEARAFIEEWISNRA